MKMHGFFHSITTSSRRRTMIGLCLGTLFLAGAASAGEPALVKLPEKLGSGTMEVTPVVFKGRQLLFACRREPGDCGKLIDKMHLIVRDAESGREVARFGERHSLGCAFVEGDTLHVFAAESISYPEVIAKDNWFLRINHFSSSDLKTWKQEPAIPRSGGEHLLNSSVCRDDDGYVMAYESDDPTLFCIKFARSKDLTHWKKVDGLTFSGPDGKQYSACPVIRYFKPYYYIIYLHAAIPGHNGWVSFMARSKDLATWQLSPKNPILEAGEGEGCNNSDVDMIEIDGKTHLYYSDGDQSTWGYLRRAVYAGPMRQFFESHFPENEKMVEVDARAK